MNEIRINKFISDSGFCTRREADEFIQTGRVTINGIVADLNSKVLDETDVVKIDGERLKVNLEAIEYRRTQQAGWRAEQKAKKEAALSEAAKNPKSRTLRVNRKPNAHKSTKLDENGRPIGVTTHRKAKPEDKSNGRMVTKGASMRMEDAIKDPTALASARKKAEAVNKKSSTLRGKGKAAVASKGRRR